MSYLKQPNTYTVVFGDYLEFALVMCPQTFQYLGIPTTYLVCDPRDARATEQGRVRTPCKWAGCEELCAQWMHQICVVSSEASTFLHSDSFLHVTGTRQRGKRAFSLISKSELHLCITIFKVPYPKSTMETYCNIVIVLSQLPICQSIRPFVRLSVTTKNSAKNINTYIEYHRIFKIITHRHCCHKIQ